MKKNDFLRKNEEQVSSLLDNKMVFNDETGEFEKRASDEGGSGGDSGSGDDFEEKKEDIDKDGNMLDSSGQILLTKEQVDKGFKFVDGKVVEPDKEIEEEEEEEEEEEGEKKKKEDKKSKLLKFIPSDKLTKNTDGDVIDKEGFVLMTKEQLEKGYQIGTEDGELYDKEGKIVEQIDESDFFKLDDPILKDEKGKPIEIDWKQVASNRGIEIVESNVDAFLDGVDEYIEKNKTKVELDLSKYAPESQAIIEYFENGGTPEQILSLTDKVNVFMSLPDDEKVVRAIMSSDAEISKEDAEMQVEMMKGNGSFDKEVKGINKFLEGQRVKILNDFIGNFETKKTEFTEKQKQAKEKEERDLLIALNKVDNFHGVKFAEEDKKSIENLIKSGRFEKLIDSPEAKLNAFLESKFGAKAKLLAERRVKNEKRISFKEGIESELIENINPGSNGGSRIQNSDRKGFAGILDGIEE